MLFASPAANARLPALTRHRPVARAVVTDWTLARTQTAPSPRRPPDASTTGPFDMMMIQRDGSRCQVEMYITTHMTWSSKDSFSPPLMSPQRVASRRVGDGARLGTTHRTSPWSGLKRRRGGRRSPVVVNMTVSRSRRPGHQQFRHVEPVPGSKRGTRSCVPLRERLSVAAQRRRSGPAGGGRVRVVHRRTGGRAEVSDADRSPRGCSSLILPDIHRGLDVLPGRVLGGPCQIGYHTAAPALNRLMSHFAGPGVKPGQPYRGLQARNE